MHLLDQTRSKEVDGDAPGRDGETPLAKTKFDDKLAVDELPGWDG